MATVASLAAPVLLAAALGLAGCQAKKAKIAPPPKGLSDIAHLGLPIEPGDAAKLGYSVGWVGSFGNKDSRSVSTNAISYVRSLDDLIVFVERPRRLINGGWADAKIIALDARSGEYRWVHNVTENLQRLFAPVRQGNIIYVNTEGNLHRFEAATGRELATVKLDIPAAAEPAVLDNFLVFSCLDGHVLFYNIRTNYATWKYKLPASIRTHPVIFGNSAFAVDSEGKYVMLSVERRELAWAGHTWGPVLVDPVQFRDTLVMACTDGILYGINRSTGEDMWKYSGLQNELGAPPFVMTTGSLIVLTVPGEGLRVLSGITGTEIVRVPTSARPVLATEDGKLLLEDSGKQQLVLMEMPSGRELIRVPAMPIKEAVPLTGGSLLLVGKDGQMLRLNPKK